MRIFQERATMVYLYHYTDLDGASGILRDQRINMSTKSTDASFGEGVYLTEMPPQFGRRRIIVNNYDSSARLKRNSCLRRRADCYFRMSSEDLAEVNRLPISRNVWLFSRHITFNQVRWEYGST